VKDIRDKSLAMAVYAFQPKGPAFFPPRAAEVKKRAGRRIGELMEDDSKAGRLAYGRRSVVRLWR